MKLQRALRAATAPLRDALYPLISLEPRSWRKAPRYYLRQAALVTLGNDAERETEAVLEDFSATGFSLSGDADRIALLLRGKRKGDRFNVTVRLSGKDWILPVELVRRTRLGDTRRAGFRVMNAATMDAFIADVEIIPPPPAWYEWAMKYWMRRGFRHAATAAWIGVLFAIVLAAPSCGKLVARALF